jgi:ketosteroid isomerase-like protein
MRLTIVLAALALPMAQLHAQDPGSAAQAEAMAVVHAFHDALAAGDSTAALSLLHDDVVILESGHAETRAEYRSGHLRADIAFASATQRSITNERVSTLGEVGLYIGESRTTGQFRSRDIDSCGAETMVLVRTAEGWRIRHIHWSSR